MRRLLMFLLVSQPLWVTAEPVAARFKEGAVHGFLVMRGMDGKILAGGDLVQTTRGDRVNSRLVFRFKDGSVDDETSVFMQNGSFRLMSDHHVQSGPSFQEPNDMSISRTKGQVSIHLTKKGEEKSETKEMEIPADLANGMLLNILKNVSADGQKTSVSYLVAAGSKPRIVKLTMSAVGKETFTVAGLHHKATRFLIKVDLGGMAGMIAPLMGKKPADMNVWVVEEGAPAFVRSESPFYLGGPIWQLEMLSPVWDQVAMQTSKR